ncbi:MAG: hypothetical protein PHR35_17135 [Kiritimatiellae bacterium]|nr:hypothetical protein [Kiritimatiellia bacterium]
MNSGTLSKLGAGMLALALLAGAGARAAEYTRITTNYSLYSLSDQTDTWTRCELTVAKLYVASNANSVAELRLISTTNNINGTHYVGYAGHGELWASNSLLQFDTANTYVGATSIDGTFYMTDSTGIVASGKTVNFVLGGNAQTGGDSYTPVNTGTLYLERSSLSGGTLNFAKPGWGRGMGRLIAKDSTIVANSVSTSASWDLYFARWPSLYLHFDHCSVTLAGVWLGCEPSQGPAAGSMVLTNKSVATISGGVNLGYGCRAYYTCALTVSGSRLNVGGDVTVASGATVINGTLPQGRVTMSDSAVGWFAGNVILGGTALVNKGCLDVLTGSLLSITNAASSATLSVGQGGSGLLTVAGGSTCRVDRLVATNKAYSVIAFSSGTLSVRSGTISNNLTTVIGDGADPATLDLWGRQPFNVTSNLVFSNKATLSVEIGGPTTNDCNYLDVHGALTFGAGSALEVNLVNGYKPRATDYITVALADTLATLPDTLPTRWIAMIVDEGGRKALKINLPPVGTVIMLR